MNCKNTHSNAYVGNASVPDLKALNILTHLHNCADSFMAGDQLSLIQDKGLINIIDRNREHYRERGDELAVVDVCVSATYTYNQQGSVGVVRGSVCPRRTTTRHCRAQSAGHYVDTWKKTTFEKNVIIADLGYRDLPYLEISWLDNEHNEGRGESNMRGGDLVVPQSSHSTLRHAGNDAGREARSKSRGKRR